MATQSVGSKDPSESRPRRSARGKCADRRESRATRRAPVRARDACQRPACRAPRGRSGRAFEDEDAVLALAGIQEEGTEALLDPGREPAEIEPGGDPAVGASAQTVGPFP